MPQPEAKPKSFTNVLKTRIPKLSRQTASPLKSDSKEKGDDLPKTTTSSSDCSEACSYTERNNNSDLARQHYNDLEQIPLDQRHKNKILNLRGFNNYVKSVLIYDFLRRIGPLGEKGAKVLDFGCGKGGDLRKWGLCKPSHVVCVDIADKSVETCKTRYLERQNTELRFKANFIVADLTRDDLSEKFKQEGIPDIQFDLVSCQFVLHYAFESQDQCKQILRNAVSHLKPGSFFFGTIPRSNYLVKKYRSLESGSRFSNDIYYVDFLEEGIKEFPLFGSKYVFYLENAVESLPEFLVHFPLLEQMMKDLGMELVLAKPFTDYVYDDVGNLKSLSVLSKTRGLNKQGTISAKEWEVISCYMVFGFKKLYDSELEGMRDCKRRKVSDSVDSF